MLIEALVVKDKLKNVWYCLFNESLHIRKMDSSNIVQNDPSGIVISWLCCPLGADVGE